MSKKILDGITVLDASQWLTGGFATLMLANQGADVIKVERPEFGDNIRQAEPPFIAGESPYYWTVNYGKRSLELDLETAEGREIMYELTERADVFVENFRPGKIDELGLGYDDLHTRNNDLVYCSISAFGQTGPLSDRPGYDLLLQAMSGIMSVTGEDGGEPVKVGIAMADLITAMWVAFAVVNALYRREHTGQGEYIDIGMLDSIAPWLTKQAASVFAGGDSRRMGTRDPMHAPYQAFEASDGYLIVACANQGTWKQLCRALDREDLLQKERFATNPDRVKHRDELSGELEQTFRTRTVNEWVGLLADRHGIPVGPISPVAEVLENEQLAHRHIIQQFQHSSAGHQPVIDHPTNYRHAEHGFDAHAPLLGEHSRSLLQSLGYDTEAIGDLFDRGIVRETGLEADDHSD